MPSIQVHRPSLAPVRMSTLSMNQWIITSVKNALAYRLRRHCRWCRSYLKGWLPVKYSSRRTCRCAEWHCRCFVHHQRSQRGRASRASRPRRATGPWANHFIVTYFLSAQSWATKMMCFLMLWPCVEQVLEDRLHSSLAKITAIVAILLDWFWWCSRSCSRVSLLAVSKNDCVIIILGFSSNKASTSCTSILELVSERWTSEHVTHLHLYPQAMDVVMIARCFALCRAWLTVDKCLDCCRHCDLVFFLELKTFCVFKIKLNLFIKYTVAVSLSSGLQLATSPLDIGTSYELPAVLRLIVNSGSQSSSSA